MEPAESKVAPRSSRFLFHEGNACKWASGNQFITIKFTFTFKHLSALINMTVCLMATVSHWSYDRNFACYIG